MHSRVRFVVYAMVFSCVLYLPSATAEPFNPQIEPTSPVVGQEITLTLQIFLCDFLGEFTSGESWYLDQQERNLHLFLAHSGPGLCFWPPPFPLDIELGSLEPGAYTLIIHRAPEDTEFPVDPEAFEVEGTFSFEVRQHPPAIPTLNVTALVLYAFAILLLGLWTGRQRVGIGRNSA